jgi:flagellar assembly protein FliH
MYMSDTNNNITKTRFSGNLSFVSIDGGSVVVNDAGSNESQQNILDSIKEEEEKAKLQEAYEQGRSECERQMSERIQQLEEELNSVTRELPAALAAYFQELELQMKQETGVLAFNIASKILGYEINHQDQVKKVIEDVLSPLLSYEGVSLRLNPEIAAKTQAGEPGVPMGIKIVADPSLRCGEALVDSPQGYIDGTLEGRLSTLEEAFRQVLSEGSTSDDA